MDKVQTAAHCVTRAEEHGGRGRDGADGAAREE